MTTHANTEEKTIANTVVYIHKNLNADLLDIIDELFYFSIRNYGELVFEITEDILSKMDNSKQPTEDIFPQLLWLVIFCYPTVTRKKTIYQLYLELNRQKWKTKSQLFHNTLSSWQNFSQWFNLINEFGDISGYINSQEYPSLVTNAP